MYCKCTLSICDIQSLILSILGQQSKLKQKINKIQLPEIDEKNKKGIYKNVTD